MRQLSVDFLEKFQLPVCDWSHKHFVRAIILPPAWSAFDGPQVEINWKTFAELVVRSGDGCGRNQYIARFKLVDTDGIGANFRFTIA
jgi:hypothetical protein